MSPEFVAALHYVDYAAAIFVLCLFAGGVVIEILKRHERRR
jgi:hypothetical protein